MHEMTWTIATAGCAVSALLAMAPGLGLAKSLYTVTQTDNNPTPVVAYDIQPSPSLLQMQEMRVIPKLAGKASALAIDASSRRLLVTNDGSNEIQLLDATTMSHRGTVIASGMSDIAALVVDEGASKLYAVQRDTDRLFVYAWDAGTPSLTLEGGSFRMLPGIAQASALALDATRGRLFVGDRSSMQVRYFDTTTWAAQGLVDLTPAGQTVTALAFDSLNNTIYAGNGDPATGSIGRLVRFQISVSTGSIYTLPDAASGNSIVGVAVDPDTRLVYVTTRLTDTLLTIDWSGAATVVKDDLGDLGDPGPLVVPASSLGYNPMQFELVLDAGRPVPGGQLTYVLCYRNQNEGDVEGVTIDDTLPAGLEFVSATGPASYADDQVTWTIGLVRTGAPRVCHELVARVTGAVGTVQLNMATLRGDPVGPMTQTASVTIEEGAPAPVYQPLGFSVDDGVEAVAQGGTLTYQLCYDNLGNTLPVQNVMMTAVVPAGAHYMSATGPVGVEGTQINWTIGALAAAAPRVCHELRLQATAEPGTQLVLAAGIRSDNTPQQKAVHATAINATSVQVGGEGGGGTTPWAVLAALAALAVTVRRRIAPVAAAVLAAGAAGSLQAAELDAYLGAGGGAARTDATAADLEAALSARGYSARAGMDRSDTGFKVFGGLRLNRYFGAEIGYVDLGKVTSIVDATVGDPGALVADVAQVHPYSVSGLTLSGVAALPLGQSFTLFAKAGLLRWDADIEAQLVPAGSPRADRGASGTDATFGIGLRWAPARWGVQAEWERFRTDRNDIDLASMSVIYRF
jgi:OmpA-OmpF porin, OOP family